LFIKLKNLFKVDEVLRKVTFLKLFLFTLIYLSISANLHAQLVYEPLYEDVYNFLRRVSQKGIIEFDDLIRPLPKMYIAEKLLEADSLSSKLTPLEREELKFFLQSYYFEEWFIEYDNKRDENMEWFNHDPGGRWRVFSYGGDGFKLNFDPILAVEIGSVKSEMVSHFWNGFYSYGYIYDVLGFSFDFRDNTESGNTIDKTKRFTPETGVNARTSENYYGYSEDKMEYSEGKMMLATDWKWGSLAVGKEFIEWGYGDNGLIVMSQKAPSFPLIRLDINPVEWLSFNYFHAWLSSDVIDSTSFYYTEHGDLRFEYRDKFLASHTLTIRPTRGLDIALGESIIYSDELEYVYLIPITFFRLADHYLSRQNNSAGSNVQFFGSVSSKGHIKNTHLYGSIIIDEITLNGLFDSYSQRNQLGFTLGGSVTDLPINNLTLKLEYSKIYPYVYKHYISTTTYTSASYVMGHWMGDNADQIYASLSYRFIRGLESIIWTRYIRQGEEQDVDYQFDQPQPPFLSGLRTNYTYLGGEARYEIIHNLFFRARYQYMNTSRQQEDLSYVDDSLQEFYVAVYYGL
jgi:hypothetical protein